jgi:hypothetical protein
MKTIQQTLDTRILIRTAVKYVRKNFENVLRLINSMTNRLIRTIKNLLMKSSMLKINSIENHSMKVTMIMMTLKTQRKSRLLKYLQVKKHFTS